MNTASHQCRRAGALAIILAAQSRAQPLVSDSAGASSILHFTQRCEEHPPRDRRRRAWRIVLARASLSRYAGLCCCQSIFEQYVDSVLGLWIGITRFGP